MVYKKSFDAPPINKKELLRYAGAKGADPSCQQLANEVIELAGSDFGYSVCYTELPLKVSGGVSYMGDICVTSQKLAKCLEGSASVLVFAATVGARIDRLIAKYSRIAPSKALMLSALGAERIEALCDAFCNEYERDNGVILTPRFSAGYGDCPLDVQKTVFSLLDCEKNIGLTLNDSMLMSPTKSVTAFVGIKEKK